MRIKKRMQILKIAKNFDSRAPLEYLQWIAYNYNIYQSFIHVSIHFHHTCQPRQWRQNNLATNNRRQKVATTVGNFIVQYSTTKKRQSRQCCSGAM